MYQKERIAIKFVAISSVSREFSGCEILGEAFIEMMDNLSIRALGMMCEGHAEHLAKKFMRKAHERDEQPDIGSRADAPRRHVGLALRAPAYLQSKCVRCQQRNRAVDNKTGWMAVRRPVKQLHFTICHRFAGFI